MVKHPYLQDKEIGRINNCQMILQTRYKQQMTKCTTLPHGIVEKLTVPSFPERITLELTNKCNLNCVFCPRKVMAEHQGVLDVDLAKRVIDEAAGFLPVAVVPFFRGESLLHPEWDKILSYMKQNGLGPVQMTSNVTLMDEDAAARIIDLQVDVISFSLDTLDGEQYEQARRGARYEDVMGNIFKLLELKAKSGKELPKIQVSAINIPQYREGMQDFVDFWLPKVDRVRIYIEHSQDGHPGSIADPLPHFEKRLPCRKVFTDMVILWDGEVALCNHDWTRDKEVRIGTVRENSVAEVWQSPRYQEIRAMHHQGSVDNEPLCKHCDHWKMYYLPDGYLGRLYERGDV